MLISKHVTATWLEYQGWQFKIWFLEHRGTKWMNEWMNHDGQRSSLIYFWEVTVTSNPTYFNLWHVWRSDQSIHTCIVFVSSTEWYTEYFLSINISNICALRWVKTQVPFWDILQLLSSATFNWRFGVRWEVQVRKAREGTRKEMLPERLSLPSWHKTNNWNLPFYQLRVTLDWETTIE